MSILNNSLLLGAPAGGGAGYQISRSLRFNSSDSAYLSRTPASAGNRKTWTWAGWVKRSSLTAFEEHLWIGGVNQTTDSTYNRIYFHSSNKLYVSAYNATWRVTTQVFRDFSAWFHLVVAVDTTQATANNRVRVYVNGLEVTAFDTVNNPTQNVDTGTNNNTLHYIGAESGPIRLFNGYLADLHLIDGQQLDPSAFTEVSATTGQLIPKAYTGTFTGNSFWLKFADNSAATATTLGKDSSGLGNNWTPNNLSVTAGAGNDSLVDTPTSFGTDTGVGNEVRGNYCTWNPLDKGASVTLTNGNLDVSTASTWNSTRATFGLTSGKWYWEYTMTAAGYTMVGIGTSVINLAGYIGQSSAGYAYYSLNGNKWNSGTAASYGNSFTTNDVIGVAFDVDTGKIWFSKNGTWQASGDPAAGTNAAYSSIPAGNYFSTVSQDNTVGATGGVLNAGQRPFAYPAPSGFKALCDTNLPAPVVAKPSSLMDVVTYTGNGGTTSLATSFSPDMVWIKSRSAAYYHRIFDQIRGAQKEIYTNATDAEATASGGSNSFTSTGFNVGSDYANTSGQSFVAWMWDAGSTTVTNTQGSITSSCRTNQSSGFSIATFSAPSSGSATIGHGLGVEPHMIIIKSRDQAYNWCVYHKSLTSNAYFLNLNTTAAQSNASNIWNNTTPTSSVFSLGSGYAGAGATVAYLFSPVSGYSSFGSYTGNGSADGPFVYTGFRPRFVLIKRTDASVQWVMYDSARDSYNVSKTPLAPNESTAESGFLSGYEIDILSNGFKIRNGPTAVTNASGSPFVYAAFAENPFQYARAR